MADTNDPAIVNADPARLTRVFIKMRDKKAEIMAAAEVECARIDEQMKLVEGALLALLGNNDTMSNAFGTVSKTVKSKYWCTDWAGFKDFVIKHADEGGLDLFERRLAQNNMKEFLKGHPGTVPPGLQSDSRYGVTVRRKAVKAE